MTTNTTNLTALTEVIQKTRLYFSDSVVTGTLPKGHNDLTKLIAQRILDAGWRRVPGVEELYIVTKRVSGVTGEKADLISTAILDLIMEGE